MNPLLKFLIIPFLFLLLFFTTTPPSGLRQDWDSSPLGIIPLDCTETYFSKTYSGFLEFGEPVEIPITVPAILDTFIVIERRIYYCEPEDGILYIGGPDFPGDPEGPAVYFEVSNTADIYWSAIDYKEDGYSDTYGDGSSFWVNPGDYVLIIFPLDWACYDVTVSIYGCPNPANPYVPPPKGP